MNNQVKYTQFDLVNKTVSEKTHSKEKMTYDKLLNHKVYFGKFIKTIFDGKSKDIKKIDAMGYGYMFKDNSNRQLLVSDHLIYKDRNKTIGSNPIYVKKIKRLMIQASYDNCLAVLKFIDKKTDITAYNDKWEIISDIKPLLDTVTTDKLNAIISFIK